MTTHEPTAPARTERRANLSDAQRALLEKRLRGKKSRTTKPAPPRSAIPPRNPDEPAVAAFAQQRLYYLHQMAPDAAAYNMFDALRLQGTLDVAALEGALRHLVERHKILRTTFATENGETVCNTLPDWTPAIPVINVPRPAHLNGSAADVQWQEALHLAQAEIRRPFDLAAGPLLRLSLLRLAEDDHLLVLAVHHIIADEWSLGIFWRELSAAYAALCRDETPDIARLPVQFADFAAWQRTRWQTGELDTQLAYWSERLSSDVPVLELPFARPRTDHQTYSGALISVPLPQDVVTALKRVSSEVGSTLFMTVLAAFNVLLYRYTGQTDLTVGTPAATRDDPALGSLIGLFLNTLVLRTDLSGNPTFAELLARVRDTALGAYAHRELPVEKLVENLHPRRDGSHNPLFQVMFVHQTGQSGSVEFPGLSTTPVTLDYGASKFDLTLFLGEDDGNGSSASETRLSLEYNTDLFDAATMERTLGHLQTLLAAIAANPAQPIGELPLLTDPEQLQLLVAWNDTAVEYGPAQNIHAQIETHAVRTPAAVAARFEDAHLTYTELNERATILARRLVAAGVGADVPVGICLERSLDMVVAILGVLKAGGGYVPLDPGYPTERLAFMLEDSAAPVVVTHSALVEQLPERKTRMLCVDENADVSAETMSLPAVQPEHLAYIIYTSGSTGRPKGVAITHANLLHSTRARFRFYPEPLDSFLLLSSFAFDSSIVGIFWTLCSGGTLVLPQSGSETDVPRLAALIEQHDISHLLCLPSLYALLLAYAPAEQLDSLRVAMVAGEACPSTLPECHYATLPRAALYNEYGPTEGSVWSTAYKIPPHHPVDVPVPIGGPIPNMQVYVLDGQRQPVPVGVPGELYIGGAGLANGYVNRPELTAERFVPHPFVEGARLYRTGDRVRFRPDGVLDFLGRMDQQVKIRGFRVELGEIESVIHAHPSVESAAVIAHGDGAQQRLVAYLAWQGSASAVDSLTVLQRQMRERLPDYMVPAQFVPLDSLPLTPNGKVDRNRLPDPDSVAPATSTPVARDAASHDQLEIQLVRIWESVLNVHPVGIHDNYFELGGHSLQAVTLFQRMRDGLGRDLPLSMLLRAPTIAEQAELLRQEGWSPSWSSLVPLQPGGSQTPFFCMHAIGGNVLSLRHLARHLGTDQPFYALQSQGLDGKETVPTTVEEMAAYYIDEMRTVQPHGPYLLGGQSSGGLVAFEVAQQLRAAGEAVALLVLIDSYAPVSQRSEETETGAESTTDASRLPTLSKSERVRFHLGRISKEGPDYIWKSAHQRAVKTVLGVRKRAEDAVAQSARRIYDRLDRPLPPRLRPIYVRNAVESALYAYEPRVYDGPITLFRATESVQAHLESVYGSQMGWSTLTTAKVEAHDVEGGHNLEDEPQVGVVAEILRRYIEKVAR